MEVIFREPAIVPEVAVYRFDDTGLGECRIPESWKIFYRAAGGWKTVENPDGYRVEKDKYNRIRFDPVRTGAMRIELKLQKDYSAGIFEWKVK